MRTLLICFFLLKGYDVCHLIQMRVLCSKVLNLSLAVSMRVSSWQCEGQTTCACFLSGCFTVELGNLRHSLENKTMSPFVTVCTTVVKKADMINKNMTHQKFQLRGTGPKQKVLSLSICTIPCSQQTMSTW